VKTDIFELMVHHRSSITAGKGFLGEPFSNVDMCACDY
jgi:hypothetical protein